jgi:hypothetical protein
VYARARWYDPQTGTFLSPDPMGYVDSSNVYAFAGGDPVNGRDATGELTWSECVAFTKSGAKTVAMGAGVVVGAAALVAAGVVSAPVVVTAGAIVTAGTVINQAAKRYSTGDASTAYESVGLGIADTFGLTTASEAYQGTELGTGRALSREERAERYGVVAGFAITAVAAKPLSVATGRGVSAVRAPSVKMPAPRAPTNPRHNAQTGSADELDALITRLGERAVREGAHARSEGMSGVAAGNYAETTFGRYLEALNNRLRVQQSTYVVEWQPATLPGHGRVPPFVEYPSGMIVPFRGSLRLDAGLSTTTQFVRTPAVSSDVYPTIIRGYDVTIDLSKVSAVTKYQGEFGVPIRDIRPR